MKKPPAALDGLTEVAGRLPELFVSKPVTTDWVDSWVVMSSDDLDDLLDDPIFVEELVWGLGRAGDWLPDAEPLVLPGLGEGFPGAPQPRPPGIPRTQGAPTPPVDVWAFYLPFHYYFPAWWGVYLLLEGIGELAYLLVSESNGTLSTRDCIKAAQIFLYGHENYHHSVETFALRVELATRHPHYRTGFEKEYRSTLGTNACLEEGLANAAGLRLADSVMFRGAQAKPQRRALLGALKTIVDRSAPGYCNGSRLMPQAEFQKYQAELIDSYHTASMGLASRLGTLAWLAFPHAVDGLATVRSSTSYLLPRSSPLAQRLRLGLRYFSYREVTERLKGAAGCRLVGYGKGSHEVWESPSGRRFFVPRHRRDLASGTLRAILKQAGLDLSLKQFATLR